jgi:ribosomal-protein-alanine N-acetyltransferase
MQALVTPRLALAPLVAAHADALYPILADPRQLEYLDQGAPASLEVLRERYRKLEARRSADGREFWLNWAIVARELGPDAIGFVQATVLEDGRAWAAYEVGHAWWGRGFATEATRAMLEHLEAAYAVTQFMATVDRRNERSWRLLERLAFRRADAQDAAAMEVQPGDWLYRRQRAGAEAATGGATPCR